VVFTLVLSDCTVPDCVAFDEAAFKAVPDEDCVFRDEVTDLTEAVFEGVLLTRVWAEDDPPLFA
jgi:hypothetical protein